MLILAVTAAAVAAAAMATAVAAAAYCCTTSLGAQRSTAGGLDTSQCTQKMVRMLWSMLPAIAVGCCCCSLLQLAAAMATAVATVRFRNGAWEPGSDSQDLVAQFR